MKIKTYATITLGLLILTSCNQPKRNPKAFTLNGKIEGSNTEYVILGYRDSSDVYISDTLPIVDQSFSTEGYLMHTSMVGLTSNLSKNSMEDPNRLKFFLEPTEIDIKLKEGEFPNAKISGSKTQVESEELNETIEPLQVKATEIYNINTSSKQLKKLHNDIKDIKIQYVVNHPKSYLSASIISFYQYSLPTDSLSMLFSNLDPKLKESYYGVEIEKTIQERINKYIVSSGDIAPNFSKENSDGDILTLNQFKGKTVLLDFGADWCLPCKKEIPQVKKIYDEYHAKGLEIIGVSYDRDKTIWKEYIKNEELNWHHVNNGMPKENQGVSISKLYEVPAIPTYILIDEKGIIVDRYRASDEENKSLDDLENKLNTLLTSK
ncbi:TlpA disulfide reductase family protein [Formosa algae]|uniref:TlpA disulfide reductase family protein n=1 Tax=Formosa algae TaxID=225843 RepID=UPI000CCDDBC0|nr:TlpA disulfide reductase family protein [Formosa algae]PNW26425.1 hypothetical protein BKP44_16995 [Formosa algae]